MAPDPANSVEWLREQAGDGYVERSFVLRRPGETVPGVLWSPRAATAPATVLLFHGGSGHRRSDRHLRMGGWLASVKGLAVIAVDGPYHGARVAAPVPPRRIVTRRGSRTGGRIIAGTPLGGVPGP